MTTLSVSASIGIDGSAAMTSHSESAAESDSVTDASDMVQLLQLQRVQARDHASGLDDPGDGGVVEQAGTQRGPQDTEMLVVASGVIAQEADLVIGQAQVLLQTVGPAGRLPYTEALYHEHRAQQVNRI